MLATGIIRHVDDLGRIVIPKEIRRKMGIQEGDALEIYVGNNYREIVFRRYSVNLADDVRLLRDRLCGNAGSYKKEHEIRLKCNELLELIGE